MAAPAVIAVAKAAKIWKWVLGLLSAIVLPAIGLVVLIGSVVAMPLVALAMIGDQPSTMTCRPADSDARLVIVDSEGSTWELSPEQTETAVGLYSGAMQSAATDRELAALFTAAMQESRLQIYANEIVPESLGMKHHVVATPRMADGTPVDALGPLQQRPSMGWGSATDIMDPAHAARAFLGGADGPNRGAPAGLRDIPGWEGMSIAAAVEAVQISGEPQHYGQWEASALSLVTALQSGGFVYCAITSGDAAYPFAERMPISDGIGPRPCYIPTSDGCAHSTWHPAIDFDGACGTPVLAMRPGVVSSVHSYFVWITAPDGAEVGYLHMFSADVLVKVGDTVAAGQQIGAIGNAGPSTGCHLDVRVNTGDATDPAVQALQILPSGMGDFVDPNEYMLLFGVSLL